MKRQSTPEYNKFTLQKSYRLLTVPDFFHNERVKANLVNALIQTVGRVDLLYLLVEHQLFSIRQFRTQDLVIELLCNKRGNGSQEEFVA